MLLFVCFIVFSCFFQNDYTYANQSLYVDAEVGIDNKVKPDSPTTMKVTITNKGEPFIGDFVVDSKISYNLASALVFPINIAKGETKTIPIYLDSYYDQGNYGSSNNDLFYFYEGGIEKGNLVDYEGDRKVTPRIIGPLSKSMVVVTTRPDEISAVEKLRPVLGDDLVTYYATSKEDPYLTEDYRGLSQVDLIIFDNIAMQDLSVQQQDAIYKWVQMGGVLAFSPTKIAKNGSGVFKEVMPLQLGSEKSVPKEVLANYANLEAVVDNINIYESNFVNNGAPTFQLEGYTFAAATNIGQGKVIQFTFPLYDAVITNLSGYGQIIKNSVKIDGYSTHKISPIIDASNWTYTNELFETVNVSVWVIVGGFLVYMIVIGPLLYKILKKRDHREKMWFYIPIIAVVTALVIFIVGAKDRIFSPQVQQMAFFEMGDDSSLKGTYVNSVLSNRAGDFEFTMDHNTTAIAHSNSFGEGGRLHQKSYLKETVEEKTLSLLDFNYWSIQSVVGTTLIEDVGQLKTDLTLQDKELTGTITNTLPIDLFDLMLLSGAYEYELGSIKAGETINVELSVNRQYLNAPTSINYRGMNAYNSVNDREKDYLLKNFPINTNHRNEYPLLIGKSDISLIPIELKGGSKQETISYFAKPVIINVNTEDEIVLTNEDTTPIFEGDGNGWGHIQEFLTNTAYISDGKVSVIYDIPNKEISDDVQWNELDINYDEEDYYLSIVNYVTGETINFKGGQHVITENITQYVNDNRIEFILERVGMDDGSSITLPRFSLKGEPLK